MLLLASTSATAQKYAGGDISMLPKYEEAGAKYFTNGRLRIDFFQPRCRLGGNNGIMGYFGKSLTISRLRFSRFSVGADELI